MQLLYLLFFIHAYKFNMIASEYKNIGGIHMMRMFYVQFTEKNLTGNAELTHLGRFIEKLKLPGMIRDQISIERADNTKVVLEQFGLLHFSGDIRQIYERNKLHKELSVQTMFG